MNVKKAIAILSVMVLAVGAMAQGGGGGGRGFQFGFGGAGGSSTGLLRRTDVKEDLKLTDDQKTKIADVLQGERGRRQEAMQGSGIQFSPDMSQDDRKKLGEVMKKVSDETTKQVNAILDADQQKRLKEIFVQFQGNAIAGNADYQKDLGITDDQKAKIAELQKKQGEAMQALFQKMRDQEIDRQGFTEATEKNTKIMNDEIGKILTDDQKKKIADWGGKPFVKKDQPGGRGGGL